MRLSVILISTLVLICCKREKPVSKDEITGHWLIESAKRADKPTNMLNGAYFIIEPDKIKSNFNGSEIVYNYLQAKNQIQISTPEHILFDYIRSDSQHLILKTNIRNTAFEFYLKKE